MLSQREVNALLKGVSGGEFEVSDADDYMENEDFIPYDLTSQDRVIRGRMPALEVVHDRFIRHFRLTLSSALRRVVDISVRSTELIKFGEFLKTLPVPSALNLFRMAPLRGHAIMILEARLVFTLIDLFFGGTGELEVRAEGRDFSAIEWRMIKRVVDSALEDLQASWRPLFPVKIEFSRGEVNPQFVAIAPDAELAVVVTFDVEMGRSPMSITLCIPYSMIEPLRAELTDGTCSGWGVTESGWRGRIKGNLERLPVQCSAQLNFGAIQAREFLEWKPGSLLTSSHLPHPEIDVFLNGTRKFQGRLVNRKWRRGIRIERRFPFTHAETFDLLRAQALKLHEKEGLSSPKPEAGETPDGEPGEDPSEDAGIESGLESLKWLEPTAIAAYLQHEHPQTITLILSILEDPEMMGAVLGGLPESLQADVTYRLTILETVQPGVLSDIDEVLLGEMKALGEESPVKLGGIEVTSEMLNSLDSFTETRILATIEEFNPDLAEQIRELMFTFQDMALIDTRGMQTLLREISREDLTLALKTASEPIRELVFSAMAQRAAEMLREDLELLPPIKLSDVEHAQQTMIKIARQLEEEGKIVIGGRGGGEVV